MTIETEVAALVAATNDLLAVVTMRREDLIAAGIDSIAASDSALASQIAAAASEVIAIAQAAIATDQAASASDSELAALAYKTAAAASAVAAAMSEDNALTSQNAAATSEAYAAAAEAIVLVNKIAAAASEVNALASKNAAATSATGALASQNASATNASNSANSANLAASNTLTQLNAVKTQTETARDAAIAGLGAADQSLNLVLLSAAVSMALDIAGVAANWPMNVAQSEALLAAVQVALDLAGIACKQVGGGNVQIAAGTVTEPSLWGAGDRNTGIYFPAADVIAVVTGGLERLRIDANGRWGLGTNAPSGLLDVNDNKLRVRTAQTPASATATGNPGEWCWDAGYSYVCTAANVWKRSALTTW